MDEKVDIPTTDEELVEMHKKARKRKRRRRALTIGIVVVIVIIFLAVVIVMLRNRVDDALGTAENEVVSEVVSTGSISTTVSGSGTLSDETVDDVTASSLLSIAEFYVEEGDVVEQGDLIATVTSASLKKAMSETQEAIDAIDEQLADAASDTVSETVKASVSGRVKEIYVTDGEEVADAMYSNGALLLLSLDGSMAVEMETDSLKAEDAVVVTTSDGVDYDGVVSQAAGGQATILITDDGPLSGDSVTVKTNGGGEVGTGTLSIHSPMAITEYTGTVSSVSVRENEKVSAGTTLLTLTDTETSAGYDALLVERETLEEQLDALIRIYKEGGICAPEAGTIVSLDAATDTDSALLTSSMSSYSDYTSLEGTSSTDADEVTVATISADENMVITISVDETDILSLSEGQEAVVTIDSIGDETYEGAVTYVGTVASFGSGVTNYSADVAIPKTDEMLTGMTASVRILIEGVEDALLIPVEALHQTSSSAYVYTEYNEDTEEFSGMVEVTTGLANSSYVEITSGLSEGDVVWYSPSGEDRSPFSGLNGGSFDINEILGGNGGNFDSNDILGGNANGGFDGANPFPGGGNSESGGGMGMPGGR